MEDEKIIQLFFDRSEEAIKLADSKYGKLCRAIANNILNSKELAEECVNSVYFKIWQAIPPQRPLSLRAFLIAAVKNEALSLMRKEKRHHNADTENELADFISDKENPEQETEFKEASSIVNGFIAGLNEKSRRMFILRYYYNHTYSTLAKLFGVSENAAKKKLQYLRNKLKDELSESGYDL